MSKSKENADKLLRIPLQFFGENETLPGAAEGAEEEAEDETDSGTDSETDAEADSGTDTEDDSATETGSEEENHSGVKSQTSAGDGDSDDGEQDDTDDEWDDGWDKYGAEPATDGDEEPEPEEDGEDGADTGAEGAGDEEPDDEEESDGEEESDDDEDTDGEEESDNGDNADGASGNGGDDPLLEAARSAGYDVRNTDELKLLFEAERDGKNPHDAIKALREKESRDASAAEGGSEGGAEGSQSDGIRGSDLSEVRKIAGYEGITDLAQLPDPIAFYRARVSHPEQSVGEIIAAIGKPAPMASAASAASKSHLKSDTGNGAAARGGNGITVTSREVDELISASPGMSRTDARKLLERQRRRLYGGK